MELGNVVCIGISTVRFRSNAFRCACFTDHLNICKRPRITCHVALQYVLDASQYSRCNRVPNLEIKWLSMDCDGVG